MPDPTPLDPTVDGLCAELQGALDAVQRLQLELDQARQRRAEVLAALDRVIRLFPPAQRSVITRRVARMDEASKPNNPRPKPQSFDGRIGMIRRWIAQHPAGHFHSAELNAYLDGAGIPVKRGYVSNTLAVMAAQGYVTRMSHARFAVNRTHPDLFKMQLEWIRDHTAHLKRQQNEPF